MAVVTYNGYSWILIICIVINNADGWSDCIASYVEIDELQRMWKEVTWPHPAQRFCIHVVGVQAKIGNIDFSYISEIVLF